MIEAQHPADLTQRLNISGDDTLSVFSTHAMSERAGFMAMRIKRLNIASYYTGIPEGEGEDQFYVALLLDPNEDPAPFEESLTETAKMIIPAVGKPNFEEFFVESYDRLTKLKDINEEQRYAFIFRDKERYLLLEKLAGGPMTKDGLAKWLSKEVEHEVTDIDGMLAPLEKTNLVTVVNISKGKKVSLEYVFLLRDIAVIRAPAIEIWKAAKGETMPIQFRKGYTEACEKFFKEYRLSMKDSNLIAGFISDPDSYEIIKVLRQEYLTKVELPTKLPREIPNLDKKLKELADANIIEVVQDKKKNVWLFLKSDILFPQFFPEYMVDVIRRRWKEGTIAKEIALKHLDILRAEYIAKEAPKYRMKMMKKLIEFVGNGESLVKKKDWEQAGTTFEQIANLLRDMAEREVGEFVDKVAKGIREDKEQYVEEKWEEDRAKIQEQMDRIKKEIEDQAKGKKKKKKGATIAFAEEKKAVSEKAEQLETSTKEVRKQKKEKAKKAYKEPPAPKKKKKKEPSKPAPSAPPTKPPAPPTKPAAPPTKPPAPPTKPAAPPTKPAAPPTKPPAPPKKPAGKDLKSQVKALEGQVKAALKAKDLTKAAELYAQIAKIYNDAGQGKNAEKYKMMQIDITKKALFQKRDQLVAAAKQAEKKKDFGAAAKNYEVCKQISSELFKVGEMKEQDNVKKFANLQKQAEAKAK
ncbi:MAG: hypothetical protein ACTSU5_20425 [Promethearchaeota archaeon]